MNKVLIIVGPTGVGKTEFSLGLAKKYNTSIISGDSIQVYKDLDIENNLIDYATSQKKSINKFFGQDTDYFKVTPSNSNKEVLYKRLGFRYSKPNVMGTMMKRI